MIRIIALSFAWAAGAALVLALACAAWAARAKARIARALRLSEAMWEAQARGDGLPHDHPREDDTLVQPAPARRLARPEWPVLEAGLSAPADEGPLDVLARPGDGWWYGD